MKRDVTTAIHLVDCSPDLVGIEQQVFWLGPTAEGVRRRVFEQEQMIAGAFEEPLLEIPGLVVRDAAQPSDVEWLRLRHENDTVIEKRSSEFGDPFTGLDDLTHTS